MPTKFTIRNEVDFIALAPVVLGFTPARSLVMMTLDSFHARIDLPEEADIDAFVDALLTPCVRHNVGRVGFVVFDEGDYGALMAQLIARFDRYKIEVLAAVQVGEGKYRQFGGDWMPLDLSTHPLTLDAHFEGVAPRHRSRDELVAYARPCGAEKSPGVVEALEGLRQREGLSVAIKSLTRQQAHADVELWTTALRSCQPDDELVPDIALVLAFTAWLAGDGALAWVAVDQADQESMLTRLMSELLEQAVNPVSWDEMNR